MGKMSKKILAGLLAVVLVLGGILLYNLQMNKSFITTFYSVTVDKPVEDLRIVLLSDLHLHEYGEDNADLVRKIQNLAPDLIAVAGDMNIDTDTDYHVVLDLMHQLVDIAPVYYAPGNHEWAGRYAGGSDALFDDIQATGVHWLNGNYEDVEFKGNSLARYLQIFADNGVVVDMISQSAPHGTTIDFSFTAAGSDLPLVMKAISAANLDKDAKASPLISVGYSKLNLFGEDMVTSCGVAARALNALAIAGIEVLLITTSDLDISLLVHAENEDAAYETLKKAYEL